MRLRRIFTLEVVSIEKLTNHQAPGIDNLNAETLKLVADTTTLLAHTSTNIELV